MSSESIDLLWNDSIKELKQLVQQEEDTHDDEAKPTPANDAFRHFAKLYIRYTILLSDLNRCLNAAVQPQKRLDIKLTLEHVICRVINLRHLLAKWCPPNPDVLPKEDGAVVAQAPFPWEYFDISMELRELSVAPSRLETATPVFFDEEALTVEEIPARRHRNSTVAWLLEEKFGSDVRPLEDKSWLVESPVADISESSDGGGDSTGEFSTEKLNGDGTESNETPKETIETLPSHDDDVSDEEIVETLPEEAAVTIQSTVRGHLSRRNTKKLRQWIDNFVGLSSCSNTPELDKLESNLVDIRHQRKQEQQYCKENYENDLHRLQNVVREEEGFAMQNELRDERIQWITEHTISKNMLPDTFEGFYTKDDDSQKEKEHDDKKEGEKKQKDAKGKGKGAKDDKKSKDAVEVERPVLAAPPTLLSPLKDSIQTYEERWQHRNVGPDRIISQYPDAEMAKDLIIRDQIKKELTVGVEEKLLSNVLKIKAMQEANTKKPKKSKKDGKGGKGKKGKGGKKAGGKKEKPLPGAKLPGMKEMGAEEMLVTLVQNGFICIPRKLTTMGNFIGGFENGRPKIPDIDKQERWIPDDPSAFQLRKAVMEYCILPLGSESIKANIQDHENIRSILFYGPEGSGKTRMVQTIASEIGALLINLSSSTIGNSFGGKEGATKLIHMAFAVAKEKPNAPVIIYLDNCHEFFMGKSKKGGGKGSSTVKTEMQRFQKDLLIYKNQALKKEDRVLVIGCTDMPEVGDTKLLRWKGPTGKPEKQGFFERSLYFPRANHADRGMLWKGFVQRRISGSDGRLKVPENMDYAALAFLSDGFNAGEISSTVDAVLSEDRLKALESEPLSEHEFSSYLARETETDDKKVDSDERFLTFTRQITTLDTVWKSINAADKKGGDGKKKKK